MDSFLSGFSHNNYEGTQIGQGYTGTVNVTGNAGSVSSQGIDVTQLQPGDTFQGEIVSVNGEDVQIQLTSGDYLAAKLERDVQVAIGQFMNLQVQSNKDNRVVLKPIYDGKMQMLRVGEAALRAAHMAVTDRNLTLVSTLLENGMSINKNTLMLFNRLTLQNPDTSMADLIKLNKLQLPVNDNSLMQLHNYQNMEHKLLDGIREASDEILKLYDTLVGKSAVQGEQDASVNGMADAVQGERNVSVNGMADAVQGERNVSVNGMADAAQGEQNVSVKGMTDAAYGEQNVFVNGMVDAAQGTISEQTALENGGKFMEQVLELLAGEDGQTKEVQGTANQSDVSTVTQDDQNVQNVRSEPAGQNAQNVQKGQSNTDNSIQNTISDKTGVGIGNHTESAADSIKGNLQEQTVADKAAALLPKQGEDIKQNTQKGIQQDTRQLDTMLNQLKGEKPQALPNKIVSLIREGIKSEKLEIKDVKQLLMDSDLGKQLTAEQKASIFRSEPFKTLLKNGLQKQWTLTPQELTQEGKVEEFYQKLAKESSQLARMMHEAMQDSGQHGNGAQARAMGNISENVEFMNQMNQMFNYVQLPLKLSNSQAHGDLYVYTNKKNMARKDGLLTAFLHLDMDNLGALDVSISLQTERSQVTTKFYLDEDSIALVEGHIDELAQRLSKKGYQCKNMILEKEEDKTVLERMEEQVAGGNAVLGYRTFDTRA